MTTANKPFKIVNNKQKTYPFFFQNNDTLATKRKKKSQMYEINYFFLQTYGFSKINKLIKKPINNFFYIKEQNRTEEHEW